MSKTKAQLAKLLAATNEQLFDRYVNIKLLQKPDKVTKAGAYQDEQGNKKVDVDDFILITPKAGMKPHITVQGTFNAQEVVHNITVTVFNISENVDTMAYNYAEVEVGYLNSGIHATFKGQIISCYMSKPNPNGELVITMSLARLTNLYQEGNIELTYSKKLLKTADFLQETFTQICDNVSENLAESLNPDELSKAIPVDWKEREFYVGEHTTRHFRSIFAVITWLNSLLATYSYGTTYAWGAGNTPIAKQTTDSETKEVKYEAQNPDLTPIKLGFDSTGKLMLSGSYSDDNPAAMKALSVVGNAFFSGDAATVTAPFNPDIMPGDVIYIDIKYFKTRVNMEGAPRERYQSLGNTWKVISSEFVFDTFTANRMVLTLNNLSNIVKGGA